MAVTGSQIEILIPSPTCRVNGLCMCLRACVRVFVRVFVRVCVCVSFAVWLPVVQSVRLVTLAEM